jgi:6-phosphogluconolactonase
MVREVLLSKVPIPEPSIHRIAGEMESPVEAAKAYEIHLRGIFKQDYAIPKFDLTLLGMGQDGHVASIFPKSIAVGEKLKWVLGYFVDESKKNRVTLTFPIINQSRSILLLCCGEDKAAIVKEIFRDDISADRYPAQMVNPVDGDLIVLLDGRAASKLPSDIQYNALHV